jgi:hypothetical protein
MWKRNLTRPATASSDGRFRRRDARARNRGHVRREGCGRRIYSIYRLGPACRPSTLSVTAGCYVFSLFRVTTRARRAGQNRGAERQPSSPSPEFGVCLHTRGAVRARVLWDGWSLPADQTKHVKVQCYGQSLAEPPDRYPGVEN